MKEDDPIVTMPEIRYCPEADSDQVIVGQHVVREFSCAYRGHVKAACIALQWLRPDVGQVRFCGFTSIDMLLIY